MKQIGEIGKVLSVNKKFMNTQEASGWLAVKKNEILLKYGDGHSFALAFNPSVQMKCAMNIEKSLTGDAPTIRQLLYTYQMEHLQVWVMAHLEDMNQYAGVKNKMATAHIKELASMIIVKSGYMKASEILLFFHKLKAGDFGGFFGTVDPQKVGEYLNAFKQWRSQELDKVYSRQAQEERERKREEWKRTGITREEYEKRSRENSNSRAELSRSPNTEHSRREASVPLSHPFARVCNPCVALAKSPFGCAQGSTKAEIFLSSRTQ